jgi:hypothetical protein
MIPGLWDMHAHFRGGADLIPDNEAWLSIFLAYGITGVREMGGDIPETVFRWRTEIANGTRLGPRILSSGPKLDGPKPEWPGSIPLTDPGSARAAVDKLKSMGADFVKIYSKDFPPDVFAAIVDEAHKQGLSVGGHLPFMTMTTRDAIHGGVRFIETSAAPSIVGHRCSSGDCARSQAYRGRPKRGSSLEAHEPEVLFRFGCEVYSVVLPHGLRSGATIRVVPLGTRATSSVQSSRTNSSLLLGYAVPNFGFRTAPALIAVSGTTQKCNMRLILTSSVIASILLSIANKEGASRPPIACHSKRTWQQEPAAIIAEQRFCAVLAQVLHHVENGRIFGKRVGIVFQIKGSRRKTRCWFVHWRTASKAGGGHSPIA